MNPHRPRRSLILNGALALLVSLTLAACGGDDDGGGGGGGGSTAPAPTPAPSGEAADLTAVCAAKDDMATGLESLRNVDLAAPTGPGDLAGAAAEVGAGITATIAELPKLPEADREAVEAANEEFRSVFVDVTFAFTDIVRSSDTAALETQIGKLSKAFDEAYGDLDCP